MQRPVALKLQCIATATFSSYYTRTTSLLRNLHWLPVEKRYHSQTVCVLMFDVKYGSAYLADLCNVCTDEQLHSTSRKDFVTLRTRTHTADSAFMVAASSAWNALRSELKIITSKTMFHNHLKTHLFF